MVCPLRIPICFDTVSAEEIISNLLSWNSLLIRSCYGVPFQHLTEEEYSTVSSTISTIPYRAVTGLKIEGGGGGGGRICSPCLTLATDMPALY